MGADQAAAGRERRRGPGGRVAPGWRGPALAVGALVALASACQPPPEVHLFLYEPSLPSTAVTALEAQADDASPAPTLGLMVSLRVKPLRGMWYRWSYTRFGLASVAPWDPDPGIVRYDTGLELRFRLPSSLGPGTFTDRLEVVACLDPACADLLPETTASVTVTYRVTVHQPPVIDSIEPSAMVAGDTVGELAVRGRGFSPGAAVSLGGREVFTRFTSAGSLVAVLSGTALPLGVAGELPVTVRNTLPIVEVSPPVVFSVYPRVPPTLWSLSPRVALAGSPGLQLSVQGSDFVRGTQVRWDGLDLPTTYRSDTLLLADVPASALAAPGFPKVQVHTLGLASPYDGQSFFVVGPAAPVADSLSPATARVGSPALVLFVLGHDFSPGCTLLWNGSARSTFVGSPTFLTGQLFPEDLAVAGPVPVTVSCTLPGPGLTSPLTFQVLPAPVPDGG